MQTSLKGLDSSHLGGHTFAERGLPRPPAVTPADPVLGSSSQKEAVLAGVDQRVPQGRQVHGSYVHVPGGLRLSARVGWKKKPNK